ncbi:MAG: hypothetical protein RM368_38635 [Nostoc sp. DedSLP03]|uniref:hypothetical protein n=1 Tax=Nostoc sp. DedSLP03 TaxID=3075400 RepID=UPI002AD394E5|nr:hypothetical protein [Nostoc sp. DedSLP03]MDZ7970779.1 hypothetical protein [Nostoc sp. DedSLP03]
MQRTNTRFLSQLQRLTTLKNHKPLELIMDIQAILTLTIQAVVMSFVALMVFDFIDSLWVVPLPPVGWEPSVIEQSTVSATSPQPTPHQEIQEATPSAIAFEKISDPWTLELQSPDHSVPTPAAIIPLPRLRLLPPAKVQPSKPKRAKAKSSTSKKSASTSTKRQSTKPRKITGKYQENYS